MKKIYLIPLLFLSVCIWIGCDNDVNGTGVYEPLYLEVKVSDSLGNRYTGDSIIIPKGKNKMIFDITTNCRWKASKDTKVGVNGWMSLPSNSVGGGDAITTANVSENKSKNDRKVYFYVVTSDSSVVKKVVIVQPRP